MSVFQRLLGFIMLAATICLPITHARAYTWRVPSEHPSICGSVDSSAYGDTVLIAPGTYEREIPDPFEYWIVMKDGITLMSEAGAEETILIAATNETANAINCDSIVDAQIIGFTIRDDYWGMGSSGIRVRASSVNIARNVIKDFYYGISISGDPPSPEQPVIRWNTIFGRHYGIVVYGPVTTGCPRIQGNRILWSLEAGIRIVEASPIVMGNTLEGNSVAIVFYGASETGLTRNRINENAVAVAVYCDEPTQLPSLNPYGNPNDANDLCGNGYCVNTHGGPGSIWAMYNYWGSVCPDPSQFSANVAFLPWFADSAHTTVCGNCETCQPATEPRTWGSIKALFR